MNDELFNKYDEAINSILVNLYTSSTRTNEIVLSNLDRKNKDHLLILRVALIGKDVFNRPLYLKTGFWNWFVLNWRMRKLTHRVPRAKEPKMSIDVSELLEFMYPAFKEYIGEDFTFADIYDEYYKGELD